MIPTSEAQPSRFVSAMLFAVSQLHPTVCSALMKNFWLVLGIVVALLVGEELIRYMRVSYAMRVATETFQDISEHANAKLVAERRRQQQSRRESRTGKDLERRCAEFRNAYAANGGPYAYEQSQLACRRYQTYVETGRLLP